MSNFSIPVGCLMLMTVACSKTEPVAPAAAAAVVVPSPAAAVERAAPAAPMTVPAEDRMEPASIDNARLPNGSPLSADPPVADDKKKTRP